MSKKHWDGAYQDAKEITPEHLLNFYLMGDSQERKEAKIEILRRLYAYQRSTHQAVVADRDSSEEIDTSASGG